MHEYFVYCKGLICTASVIQHHERFAVPVDLPALLHFITDQHNKYIHLVSHMYDLTQDDRSALCSLFKYLIHIHHMYRSYRYIDILPRSRLNAYSLSNISIENLEKLDPFLEGMPVTQGELHILIDFFYENYGISKENISLSRKER